MVRLATFNLLHGRSPQDGLVDGDRLTAAVTALNADILALQEVDRDQSRSGHLDLTAIAARALDAPDHRFAAAVVGTPGERFRPLTHDQELGVQPARSQQLDGAKQRLVFLDRNTRRCFAPSSCCERAG